ncbi:Uncharacterised protein [Enterobacter hormaechei]|nr:Uncharacterised protein [Enterobacter hormaechei]
MMMKPIKCKKLAVSRVSSPPRCSASKGVPFEMIIDLKFLSLPRDNDSFNLVRLKLIFARVRFAGCQKNCVIMSNDGQLRLNQKNGMASRHGTVINHTLIGFFNSA